jgi:hypothetical protein
MNFKRYKFATIQKKLDSLSYNFFSSLNFIKNKFKKAFIRFQDSSFKFNKIYKIFNNTFKLIKIRKLKLLNFKFFTLYIPAAFIFFGFLYISIPIFYTFEKSNLEKKICEKTKATCSINGKINYRFFPTPRINITNLVIKNTIKKNTLIDIKNLSIVVSLNKLLKKENHHYKKIVATNFEINVDFKNLNQFKNLFLENNNHTPLYLEKGKIILNNNKEYVGTINNIVLDSKHTKDVILTKLKGNFLNHQIQLDFNKENIKKNYVTEVVLKVKDFGFFAKVVFSDSKTNPKIKNGSFLIRENKNKINGVFDYKDYVFKINKSNLRSPFIDGKLNGEITVRPFFEFDLDLNLNSLNFTKLYNSFLFLDKEKQINFFKVNNRINGKLNIQGNKIYSKNNLINSFESRIKFYNGNVKIDQLLLSLGKLGAADMTGYISNDKKFSNLKYESNIFVDNKKKFLSKFGIYNKKKIFSDLFISGNFDFTNVRASFYEISNESKLSIEDVNYIESEFNNEMLEKNFQNLFDFSKFKSFLKSIQNTNN